MSGSREGDARELLLRAGGYAGCSGERSEGLVITEGKRDIVLEVKRRRIARLYSAFTLQYRLFSS